jgi:hypothetical protein
MIFSESDKSDVSSACRHGSSLSVTKHLSRAIDNGLSRLPDDECSRDHQPAYLEMMSVLSLAGTRIELLMLDFSERFFRGSKMPGAERLH